MSDRVVAFGGAARSAPPVDQFSQLAGYVLVRLTAWWPGKVGRELADERASKLFVRALADGLAAQQSSRELVDAGLQRIQSEGAEWPPLEVPRLLRYFSPVPDYEAAFAEAQADAVARLYGEGKLPEAWSHPAVYWAADRFSWFELRNASWDQAKKRWPKVLDEVLAWGRWETPRAVLPAPGKLRTEGAHRSALQAARELLRGAADRRDVQAQVGLAAMEKRGLWTKDD